MARNEELNNKVTSDNFTRFLGGWMNRLAGAGANKLPKDRQLFWQQVSSLCALDLRQGSPLLGLSQDAEYSTYLILTTLLYTNSLFADDDFIVAYGIPSSLMLSQGGDTANINQALLDSLQLSQPLMLICENMEHCSYNTKVHQVLSAANPNWHEVKAELSRPLTTDNDQQLSSKSDEAYFAPFLAQLFSGRQIKAQLHVFQ